MLNKLPAQIMHSRKKFTYYTKYHYLTHSKHCVNGHLWDNPSIIYYSIYIDSK